MSSGGSILSQQAYAQGKMLDHSEWYGVLPRNITPSDIDMVIDNAGDLIHIEISSQQKTWDKISKGQLLLYQNVIKNTANIAVLLRHETPTNEQIKTLSGCVSFQVMMDSSGFVYSKVFDGNRWKAFVENGWFGDPCKVRDYILLNRYEYNQTDIPY